MRSKVLILILILAVLPSEIHGVEAALEGEITFQPSEIPNIQFNYNSILYRFELRWKGYYLNIKPFAVYDGEYYGLDQIIPFLKNQYPNVDYRTAVKKFKNYHRWGFWLEKLPQNVADNLDYLGFDISDNNIPLSAVEIEEIDAVNFTFKRIHIGGKFTLDFYDLYERGFEVTINKTTILIGNVKGKTDLDLDPITYAAPYILVIGTNGGAPWNFWDVWNASNVNGWGVVQVNTSHLTQYIFDARLQVGNGVDATEFEDTNKQIYLASGVVAHNSPFIVLKDLVDFTLGEVVDESEKTTRGGIDFFINESVARVYIIRAEAVDPDVYLYGCTFKAIEGNGKNHYVKDHIKRIWGCSFTDSTHLESMSYVDIAYTSIYEGDYALNTIRTSSTMEKVWVIGTVSMSYLGGAGENSYNDVYARGISNVAFVAGYTGNTTMLDIDSDSWNINWFGEGNTGEIFRQNTFNLLVLDNDGTAIENADISLTYEGQGGGTAYTGATPANGSIPEQIITKGFYNATGDDDIYAYEPYNLTISLTGYETISFLFNVSDPVDWTVALVEESVDVIIQNDLVLFIFALLSIITFIGFVIAENPVVSVSSAALSFVCWGITGLVYLYNNYDFPGPALLFGLFATISLIYALWAGWKLLNPYAMQEIEDV